MKSAKRKRETRSIGGVTASMSQISLSNLLPKKRQRSIALGDVAEEKSVDKSTSNYKPKYLKVSDYNH